MENMKSGIAPIFEYGHYGYNVFEVPQQCSDVRLLPKMNLTSRVNTQLNVTSKSAMVDVDINTGEYYEPQTNEADYTNLINFVKVNQVGRIPRISPTVKVLMGYEITTPNGATVDGGVRIAEVSMTDCITILPITSNVFAPYRIAKRISVDFVLHRFRNPLCCRTFALGTGTGYRPVNERKELIFRITSIQVLGEELGRERSIPKCMNGGNYPFGSQTLMDIENNSVGLFSSIWYDLTFNEIRIPEYVASIDVPIEIITPIIAMSDATEIDALLEKNVENFYPGDESGEINVDMFKPLIQRPHCPGSLPHDYFKYWDKKPRPPFPNHHGNGSHTHPVHPGPEWPPHGCHTTNIDVNNITVKTPPGVYTYSGMLKYSWDDLQENGVISISRKEDTVIIGSPDTSDQKSKITSSDIGPVLVIPEHGCRHTVIEIAESTFFGCENLERVYLPNSVYKIGKHAFYKCSSLESVVTFFPEENGICEICDNAFMYCTNLVHISVSPALSAIGERAFYHCYELKLVVPPSVSTIGKNAFHEIFRVICSPKTDLSGTGIDESDVEFFTEDNPYYNPEDYIENPENPGGGEDNTEGGETNDPETPGGDSGNTGQTGGIGEAEVVPGEDDW